MAEDTTQRDDLPIELDPRSARKQGRTFDPGQHYRKLGGRGDYLDIKWRLIWLRSDFPQALIETRMIEHKSGSKVRSENMAVFEAKVTLPDGMGMAMGHGSETQSDFNDYLEKAETKSVGRALEYLGYGTTSAKDDDEALADAPYRDEDYRDNRSASQGRRDTRRDDDRDRRPSRSSRDFEDEDDEEDEAPRKPARRADPAPAKSSRGEEDEEAAIEEDTNKALGFPPVKWRGETIVALIPIQKAMVAAKTHEERRELNNLAVAARWPTKALVEVKQYWRMANEADSEEEAPARPATRREVEDAAGKILDEEDDDE